MAPTLFGLTGGIATGKSTVAAYFRGLGIPVIDADVIARQVVAPGSDGLHEIVNAFGEGVLTSEKSLDRKAMAQVVFADAKARRRLELIVHPRIREASAGQFQELVQAGNTIVAYEAALLVENGLADRFRPLVVVICDPLTQLQRLRLRDGLSEEDAMARLASQMPVMDKARVADHVINTSTSLEEVHGQAVEVLRSIRDRLLAP